MLSGQMRVGVKQLFAQRARLVLGLVRAALLQLGNHQVDEVDIAFRGDDAGQVEAVQAGFGDPRFQLIGHLPGRADHGDVAATQGVLLQQFAPGPVVVLQVFGRRLDRVALDVLDRFVDAILGKIDAGGGRKMRHAGLGAGVAQVFGVLGPSEFFSCADDHVQAHEHFDVLRVAPGLDGAGANLVHLDLGRRFVLAADEHALGVAPGEQQTAIGTTRLE
ncbi:hypothetical protein D3C76_1077850 [compost metagenome]